ncbi:uncharacterized protein LOC130441489 [Diorhabda sublineata]|uniref:uncharacterized protein LOC130441489 n=1 Tax=Diorhabda sublineata TaxID=1163346 RepID=UPI0024E046F0|nr:uncharacterized protein LOC130441489 [Diorhabda sublineata]
MKHSAILFLILAYVLLADAALNLCYNYRKTSLKNNNDPDFYVDKLDIDIDHPAAWVKGELTNLSIWFEEPIATANFGQLFNFTYPNLTVLANYDITGNIGDLFDIYGSGDCKIQMFNFSLSLNILEININQTTICIKVVVDVDVQQTPIEFYNFMDGAELQDLFNRAMKSIVPDIIKIVWEEIRAANEPEIEDYINKIINGQWPPTPFQKIVDTLLDKQGDLNMI